MVMATKEVQPLKVLLPMALREVGMAIEVRATHWKNVKVFISVTEVGMETVISEVAW